MKELSYLEKVEKDYLRIEAENKRYKQALKKIGDYDWDTHEQVANIARRVLKGES